MKRTKERIDFQHPSHREGISGLTFFGKEQGRWGLMGLDGEDEQKNDRVKQQIEENKYWIGMQKEEKKMKDDIDKREEFLYGKQDINSKLYYYSFHR